MTRMVRTNKKDDAVSPVVGVMLMLVVTIVIAAVVTLFATGLTTSAEAAPVAVLQGNASAEKVTFTHMGGDELDVAKMKIMVNGAEAVDSSAMTGVLFAGETLPVSLKDKLTVNQVNVQVVYDGTYVIYDKNLNVVNGGDTLLVPLVDSKVDSTKGVIALKQQRDNSWIVIIKPNTGYSIVENSVRVQNYQTGSDESKKWNLTRALTLTMDGTNQTWEFDNPTNSVKVTCEFSKAIEK